MLKLWLQGKCFWAVYSCSFCREAVKLKVKQQIIVVKTIELGSLDSCLIGFFNDTRCLYFLPDDSRSYWPTPGGHTCLVTLLLIVRHEPCWKYFMKNVTGSTSVVFRHCTDYFRYHWQIFTNWFSGDKNQWYSARWALQNKNILFLFYTLYYNLGVAYLLLLWTF